MKKLFVVLSLMVLVLAPMSDVLAKGGGRGGGGGRSTSRPATSKPSTPKATPAPKPVTQKVQATKPVVSNTGKKMSGKGTVVNESNKPKFKSGYDAPVGSVIYYPERGFMDYLPWIFLFTQESHREVVVQSTNDKGEVSEQTQVEEGVDTMYVINWIISILLLGGLIYLIMRLLSRKK